MNNLATKIIDDDCALENQKFTRDQLQDAMSFYHEYGYVVFENLIFDRQCNDILSAFDQNVRRSAIPILRQKNMRYESNRFSNDGFLENPIFNVQDLQTKKHGPFRNAVLDLLTQETVTSIASFLLGGDRVKIIQSMFFEAPAGTWPHQDSYYQDSATQLGRCVAAWFALEDIHPGAGRFYVCPGSHKSMEVVRNSGTVNFADGHENYKRTMQGLIDDGTVKTIAPPLCKGDVLFWNSLTVHGSFAGTEPGVSRQSLTAHYLRANDEMLQFHTRIRSQKAQIWNRIPVGLLHPQDKIRNRATRQIAYRFPKTYMMARKAALKLLLTVRRG